ncbi:MAG: hypothetical protein J5I93_00735, partial [Pirellulaceae bacterium]|nr:hypothetical protein [Pirellulaceae bacterium]
MLSSTVLGHGQWSEQGPSPVLGGQTLGLDAQDNPVVGAVHAVQLHPVNPALAYLGSVNGGVWRTDNLNVNHPIWVSLTDDLPTLGGQRQSLSVAALALNPYDSTAGDTGDDILYVGAGQVSSASFSPPGKALLKTSDGGASWEAIAPALFGGLNVTSIVFGDHSGSVLVATERSGGRGGVFQTDDGGQTWTPLSTGAVAKLPIAGASHLLADRASDIYYAAVPGQGIFRSLPGSGGNLWETFHNGIAAGDRTGSSRIKLALHSAGSTVLYAGLINSNGRLSNVYRTDNGIAWSAATQLPETTDDGRDYGLHPSGQGSKHFSIVADSRNPAIVYVGGDTQGSISNNQAGATDFVGRVFRGTFGATTEWEQLIVNGASGTAPHADSREMVFVADDVLGDYIIEVDDGGIYRLDNPRGEDQDGDPLTNDQPVWAPRHGNLGLAEFGDHRLAYDPLNQRLLGGFQDIGAALQTGPNQLTWQTTIRGDGNTQAVAVLDINQNGQTDLDDHVLHYVMGNNFAFFYRREFDGNGQELSPPIPDSGPTLGVSVALAVPGANLRTQARFRENWAQALTYTDSIETFNRGSFWSIPFVVNAVDPERLALGSYSVYESHDRGEHIRIVDTLSKGQSYVSALAYGGRDPQAASGINRDVMYVARGSRVEVRHHLPPPGTKADSDDERFVAGRFFAADGTLLTGGPRSGISDLALDPDDWRRAIAVENSHIYMTEDGGRNWHDVTGSLADDQRHGLRTVEVVRHGGQLIVLVGGQGAVYRAFNPSPVTNSRPVWAAYGLSPPEGVAPLEHTPGLPGVQVMDLDYSPGLTADPADDVLLIGTAGRGAWAVADVLGNGPAGGQLSQPGVLHVQGTAQDDVIRLALAPDDPLTVEVFVNNDGFVADRRVPLISLHRIQVDGLGGDDDLVIDNAHGVLSLSGPVDYVDLAASFGNLDFVGGDGFDRVLVEGLGNVDLEELDLSSQSGVLQISSQGRFQVVTASGTEMLDTTALSNPAAVPAGAVAELGSALQSLAIVLNQMDDADYGAALAGLGVDLPGALMGADIFEPDPISDARQVFPGGKPLRERKRSGVTAGISLLRRLIEEGPQGFRLADIGSFSLATPQELAERLDALDDTAGNVFLVPDTPPGTTLLDVRIVRPLSGEGHLEAEALGGNLAVSGNAAVSARVSAHLLVGVDEQGFFLRTQPTDADGQVEPELVIDQVQATGSASGQLGFLEAELLDVSLVVDPQTRLEIDLRDPAAGTPEADGLLRVAELLNGSAGSLLSVTTYGDGQADGQPDVVLSGRVIPKLLNLDLPETMLAVTWPNATDLSNVQIDTTGPLAALRDLSLAEIRQTIDQLLVVVQQATGQDLREVPLPLINKSVGELLDGPSRPLLIDDLDVDSITEVGTAESPLMFVEATGIALGLRGVRAGQLVQYRDADGQTRQGTISGLDAGGFVLAVPVGQPAPDMATPGFEIQRAGVLATLVGTLQDGLAVELPTLQELIGALADLTGFELLNNISVVDAGDGPMIQLPVSFDIEPYRYALPLDFSGRVAGLSLEASAQLELEVEPAVAITLGISLAPELEPAERFFIMTGEAGQPELSLAVTARLNDPAVEGAFGFLNVNLSEDLPPGAPNDDPETPEDEDGNEGIELNLAVQIELTDPGTGAESNGRLTLDELLAPDTSLADVFDLGFAGFLDLDGLRINASLGDSTELGNLRLSLRGEPEDDGGGGLPGQFTNVSQLVDVLTSIDVQGELTAFESFQTLNVQVILDMLDALGSELSKLGAGGVFDTKLPLVNRSLNDLIDLGQAFVDQFGDGGDQDLSTASNVEQFLNQKLDEAGLGGLDVAVIITTEDIRFRVTLAGSFQQSVPVSFQVGQQFGGLSLTGDGTLAVAADALLGLTFGVRTGQVPQILDRVFVDLAPANATDPAAQPELSVHVSAQAGYDLNDDGRFDELEGSALTFQASIGPLRFAVDEARLRIDGTLGADFQLERPDGSLADDQRLTLRDLRQVSVVPVFEATVEAIVPLDGPADADALASPVPGGQSAADALVLVAGRLTELVAPQFHFSQSLPFHALETPTADNATDNNPATPLDVSDPLTADELATLDENTIVVGAFNVEQLVESTLINFGDLFANLDDLIAWGSELLGVDILNFKLPLIGRTLQDAFDFFNSPQGATLRSLLNDLIADPDTSNAMGLHLSNESVYDAAMLLADVLRKIPGIKTIGDADRDGVIESDLVPFNGRMVLERGDDLVQLERDPDNTTEVLVSGAQFTLIDDDPDVAGDDSLRIQLVGANFPRAGIAVDDEVRYFDARGEAATGRVARVENDMTSGENNVLIVRLDDAIRVPEAGATFTFDAHTEVLSVTFALMFQPAVDAELFAVEGFDLGIEFLNFRATGAAGLSFHGDLTMLLGLGYQRGGEFFLKTDFSDLDTDVSRPGIQPPSSPEISLSGELRANLDTQFELGFLDVGAQLDPAANRLEAHLQVDLKGAAGRPNDPQALVDDGRLTLTELLEYNFDQLQTLAEPSFTVEAHLDAELDASITPNFPSLSAHLALDWGDADATQADGFRPFHVFGAVRPAPQLQLREIRLEAGQFIDRIARRVLERVDQFLPIPPVVVDALNAKIPLLKQTPIELLASFGVLDESDQRLLEFLVSVVTLIERSEDLGDQTLGVNFDPVNLVPDPADGSQPEVVIPATSSPIGRGEMDATPNDEQLDDPPGAGLPLGIGNFFQDLADLGIVFPFLRLKDLAGVLVGKDVDLVFAQLPELDLANVDLIEKTIVIPPGIPILLEGSLSVSANLSAGFDTRGIRSGQVLDGFYLGDRRPGTNRTIEASDPEQQEFGFTGELTAGVGGSLNVGRFTIASASVGGGLMATVGIDLRDPNNDGKVHLDELQQLISSGGPLGFIELQGCVQLKIFGQITLVEQQAAIDITIPIIGCAGGGVGGGGGGVPPEIADQVVQEIIEVTGSVQARLDRIDQIIDIIYEDSDEDPYDGDELLNSAADRLIFQEIDRGLVQVSGRLVEEALAAGLRPGSGVLYELDGRLMRGVVVRTSGQSLAFLPQDPLAGLPRDGQFRVMSGRETLVVRVNGAEERFGPHETGSNFVADVLQLREIRVGTSLAGGLGPGNDYIEQDNLVRTPLIVDAG